MHSLVLRNAKELVEAKTTYLSSRLPTVTTIGVWSWLHQRIKTLALTRQETSNAWQEGDEGLSYNHRHGCFLLPVDMGGFCAIPLSWLYL
ncbi:hypothetical protein SLA2020_288410 [Shorea laevis]